MRCCASPYVAREKSQGPIGVTRQFFVRRLKSHDRFGKLSVTGKRPDLPASSALPHKNAAVSAQENAACTLMFPQARPREASDATNWNVSRASG
jgi:hypothetical protein